MEDIKTERYKAIMEIIATDPGAVADMLVAWETELSKVMPADYKDWWQNAREEWPMVARVSIESLREREQLAWDMLDRGDAKLAWEMFDREFELGVVKATVKGNSL